MSARRVPGGPGTDVREPGRDDVLLSVRGLCVEFATGQGWVRVVDDLSFDIRAHETLGLVGESGSGKSVTALSVLGLLPAGLSRQTGSVLFDGTELLGRPSRVLNRVRGRDVAMVFQEPMTSLNPAFTVGEQIAEQVRRHRDCSRRQAWNRAVEVLDLVGVPSASIRARAYPHEFSGGMRQRVVIAMALSCEPRLLIADEPTTALDVTIQSMVLDLVADLQRQFGMAILFVTHDLGVVAELCDRVAVMYAGQLVEDAPVEDVFDRPNHPYTQGLLLSIPQLDGGSGRLRSIRGAVPAPSELPAGCRFHPRCDHAVPGVCTPAEPPLLELAGRRNRCVRAPELELGGAP